MWLSFFIYSVLTALLPGPNNILILNNTLKVGYHNSRSLLLGIFAGFTLVMLLSAFFTEIIIHSFSGLLEYLKYFGAIYLLYLAWSVARSKAPDVGTSSNPASGYDSKADFWKGFTLQLVNVKIIIYGITAFSSFVLPHFNERVITLAFALFLSVVGSSATWVWAVAGHKLSLLLHRHYRFANSVMGLLLVYCAFSLFL